MKTKKAWRLHIDEVTEAVRHGDYADLSDIDILRKVREMLPGRWSQGSNALNSWHLPTSPMAENAVWFCLRGACIKVLKPSAHVVSTDLHIERSHISRQIARALGFESNALLVQWNDTQGRTEAEVLHRVDNRIKVLEEEEGRRGRKKLEKDDIGGADKRGRYD